MDTIENIVKEIRNIYEQAARPRDISTETRLAHGPQNKMRTYTFKHPDIWDKKLFIATCQGFGLQPFRNPGDGSHINHVECTELFYKEVLWPEFLTNMRSVNVETEKLMDIALGSDGPWNNEIEIPL